MTHVGICTLRSKVNRYERINHSHNFVKIFETCTPSERNGIPVSKSRKHLITENNNLIMRSATIKI